MFFCYKKKKTLSQEKSLSWVFINVSCELYIIYNWKLRKCIEIFLFSHFIQLWTSQEYIHTFGRYYQNFSCWSTWMMLFLRVNIFIKVYLGTELVYLTFFSNKLRHNICPGMKWAFHEQVTKGRVFHKDDYFSVISCFLNNKRSFSLPSKLVINIKVKLCSFFSNVLWLLKKPFSISFFSCFVFKKFSEAGVSY